MDMDERSHLFHDITLHPAGAETLLPGKITFLERVKSFFWGRGKSKVCGDCHLEGKETGIPKVL